MRPGLVSDNRTSECQYRIFGLQSARTEADVTTKLLELGLDTAAAQELAQYIQSSGGLLAEMGIPPHLAALVAGLHHDTWFKVDGSGRVIATKLGARQGCKFGALICNLAYGRALHDLQHDQADAFLHLPYNSTAPPGPTLQTHRLPLQRLPRPHTWMMKCFCISF